MSEIKKDIVVVTAWKSFEDDKEYLNFTDSISNLTERFLLEYESFKDKALLAELRTNSIQNATPEGLMQNELVRELVREVNNILYIGQCLCDRGYTSRNLHEPNTYCGQLDDLQDAVKKFEVKK